jgi:hypothetical protein
LLVLECNYIVRGTATESAVELRETTGNNTIDQALSRNGPAPALLERSHRETTTHCAHVTYHQKNILLPGNQRKSFPNPITLAQTEQIVIKEEDPDHINAVSALLELRQDHACEFVTARHISGKHIGNFHDLLLPSSGLNYLLSPLEIDNANTNPISILGQRPRLPHTFGGFVAGIAIEVCRLNSWSAGQRDMLMRSGSCDSFDCCLQRFSDAIYPFIVEATEER